MTHTLWHRGILIGETNFEGDQTAPLRFRGTRRHLAGVFRPTAYGRRLLPRLCGILSAGADLREELLRRGLDPDDVPPAALREVLDSTPVGERMLDIGYVLSEVELRGPSGVAMRMASIGFMDIAELSSLGRRLDCTSVVDEQGVPPHLAEFIVSVTLRDPATARSRSALVQ